MTTASTQNGRARDFERDLLFNLESAARNCDAVYISGDRVCFEGGEAEEYTTTLEKHQVGGQLADYMDSLFPVVMYADSRGVPLEWESPLPLESAVEGFPVDALPRVLRDFVLALSESTQTPPDMGALLVLSVVAASVAKKIEIQGNSRDHIEPLNIYTVSVLDPGNRKSSTFRAATKPLDDYQRDYRESVKDDIAAEKSEHRQTKKRLTACEKTAAEGKTDELRAAAAEEARDLAIKLDRWPEPQLPSLIARGPTSEALTSLLAANGERMGVFTAEGGIFDLMKGRYSSSSDFNIYLIGHSGDSESDERQSRSTNLLESPAITIGMTVQPSVIASLAKQREMKGRGLLARFLYAVPRSTVGSRSVDPEPIPFEVSAAYEQVIRQIAEMELGEQPDLLTLGDEASGLYRGLMQWVEDELGDGCLEEVKEWGSKLAGLVLRLAGLIHCVQSRDFNFPMESADKVGHEAMESAIQIGRWAIGHARVAHDMLNHSDGERFDDGRYVLRWIHRERKESFTRSDIYRHGRRRFTSNPERLDAALALLTETNHIEKRDTEGKVQFFDVNPRSLRLSI